MRVPVYARVVSCCHVMIVVVLVVAVATTTAAVAHVGCREASGEVQRTCACVSVCVCACVYAEVELEMSFVDKLKIRCQQLKQQKQWCFSSYLSKRATSSSSSICFSFYDSPSHTSNARFHLPVLCVETRRRSRIVARHAIVRYDRAEVPTDHL